MPPAGNLHPFLAEATAMSQVTRSLIVAIVRFEQEARFKYGLTRKQVAVELLKLRERGHEFAREQLLRYYA
jgi:hypothetical protein